MLSASAGHVGRSLSDFHILSYLHMFRPTEHPLFDSTTQSDLKRNPEPVEVYWSDIRKCQQ